MSGLFILALVAGFICLGGAFAVALYLDLHVRAQKQSGSLPKSTRTLFNGVMTLDATVLYGPEYVALDQTTRRLVPIVRVLVPMAFIIIAGLIAWGGLSQP
ncbi:MAG: hypothetical protein QME55_12555 [Brevundimonas sp.]|uniref:hypothetical protein n=1 Tax=Brevundimonas sp. TaxID=1871086 RepID=UPI00261AB522|nr:hypothetical protein [Brevundimonas sp.]MDI6625555.1 hypothetical protein [Brevundimonas sp.]MDQ7812414.1 hypothetical protein [Brevundimonas sp.]